MIRKLLKRAGKKKAYYDLAEMQWDKYWHLKEISYSARFEDILKPLRDRLAGLEQDLDSIDEHPDKQKITLQILTRIRNTKEEIRRHQTNLQCSKNMSAIRSQKVPDDVEDPNAWNDCWHDQKLNVFVTHNEYFKGIPNARTRQIQTRYERKSNDDGIAVEGYKIKFFFGYPSLRLTYDDKTSVNFLLPTLTDDMITKEIVKARLMPESAEEAIMYQTSSESWIEIGNGQLRLTETEYELGKNTGRYYYEPMELVKMIHNRN